MEFAGAHSQGTNSILKMNTKFIQPSGRTVEKEARGANKARRNDHSVGSFVSCIAHLCTERGDIYVASRANSLF